MMSASSDVERELSRLKGEITASAPKQLEGGANGSAQASQAQGQSQGQAQGQAQPQAQAQPQDTPPQTQPAGFPATDLTEPQDGEGS
jgi:hypothetical protein